MSEEARQWGTDVLPAMLAVFFLGVGLAASLLAAAFRWARTAVGSL
jgi:hypothetical protein